MHISEQAKVKAASCWMSHYLTLCVLLCVCVCVFVWAYLLSWIFHGCLFTLYLSESASYMRGVISNAFPHSSPILPLSLMHTHTHTHTHRLARSHPLYIFPLCNQASWLKSQRNKKVEEESDGVGEVEWCTDGVWMEEQEFMCCDHLATPPPPPHPPTQKTPRASVTVSSSPSPYAFFSPPPQKKKTQHLLSTCSCAISFIFLYCCPAHRLPTTSISFVLLSFGSSTSRRSHGADGTVRFRGQIIPFSWMRLFFFVWFLGSAYML